MKCTCHPFSHIKTLSQILTSQQIKVYIFWGLDFSHHLLYLDFTVKILISTLFSFPFSSVLNHRILPTPLFKSIPVKNKFSQSCLGLQPALQILQIVKSNKRERFYNFDHGFLSICAFRNSGPHGSTHLTKFDLQCREVWLSFSALNGFLYH